MKARDYLLLFLVITAGATLANLIALKIAAVQVQGQLDASNNSWLKLLR